jgi:hypothetical protein
METSSWMVKERARVSVTFFLLTTKLTMYLLYLSQINILFNKYCVKKHDVHRRPWACGLRVPLLHTNYIPCCPRRTKELYIRWHVPHDMKRIAMKKPGENLFEFCHACPSKLSDFCHLTFHEPFRRKAETGPEHTEKSAANSWGQQLAK